MSYDLRKGGTVNNNSSNRGAGKVGGAEAFDLSDETSEQSSGENCRRDKKISQMLEEIKELDNRLLAIKKRLNNFRTDSLDDSIFTQSNINSTLELIKKITPEDTGTINALNYLLRLSYQPASNFSTNEKCTDIAERSAPNIKLAQLKSIVPQNRMI